MRKLWTRIKAILGVGRGSIPIIYFSFVELVAPSRFRRLREHGPRGRDGVRVNTRGPEDHQARSDPAQRQQHHHGEVL